MEKYDAFISFKNSDENGEKAPDYYMAQKLYDALTEKGIKVFFSPVTLREKGIASYAKYIDAAIEGSDILIAVSTDEEHFRSKWVEYEIDSFRTELNNENKDGNKAAMISFITKNVNVKKLPMCLRSCEAFTDQNDLVEWVVTRVKRWGEIVEKFTEKPTPIDLAEDLTGKKLLDRYQILNVIGKGGVSTIYLAYDEHRRELVAVKTVRDPRALYNEELFNSMEREMEFLRKTSHPGLPRLYDVVRQKDRMIIVMNYIEGRALNRIIDDDGPLSEEKVIFMAKKIGDLLRYFYHMKPPVIYRDMKPANIMVKPDGGIVLLDFGTIREYDPAKTCDEVCLGTIGYAAPEQFGGLGQTDWRTDIYGLGMTMYHAITGVSPARAPFEMKPIRSVNPNVSEHLESIILKCIRKNRDERYQTVDELLEDLGDPERIAEGISPFDQSLEESAPWGTMPVTPLPVPRVKEFEEGTGDTGVLPAVTGVLSNGDTAELSTGRQTEVIGLPEEIQDLPRIITEKVYGKDRSLDKLSEVFRILRCISEEGYKIVKK